MIEAMAKRWGSAPALLGFGLLNEPLVRFLAILVNLRPAPQLMSIVVLIQPSTHPGATLMLEDGLSFYPDLV